MERRVLVVGSDQRTVSGNLAEATCVVIATVSGRRVIRWAQYLAQWNQYRATPPRLLSEVLRFALQHRVEAVVSGQVEPLLMHRLIDANIVVLERDGQPATHAVLLAADVLEGVPRRDADDTACAANCASLTLPRSLPSRTLDSTTLPR